MRHRITDGALGLGNPEPVELINNGKLENSAFWDEFLKDAQKVNKVFENYGGFDFTINNNFFAFGIEPSYQYDAKCVIKIDLINKEDSMIERGVAFGYYGSNVLGKTKKYGDYKNKTKFTAFIDKWQPLVKEELIKA